MQLVRSSHCRLHKVRHENTHTLNTVEIEMVDANGMSPIYVFPTSSDEFFHDLHKRYYEVRVVARTVA